MAADPSFAGAISSIRYRGREYLNAADHGRELQGAVQFGAGECLNPTLAGASEDDPGRSTSVLLTQRASSTSYQATTRMAYWHRYGRRCEISPGTSARALNTDLLSDLTYSQTQSPGFHRHANAILDQIVITAGSSHPPASVEALTGYMPPEFDTFLVYDAEDRGFTVDPSLAESSGERSGPLILSTADGSAAMGVLAVRGEGQASYAGFHSSEVGKWSVVFRAQGAFTAGPHTYSCVWVIGTRKEVMATLLSLIRVQQLASYAPWIPGLVLVIAAAAAALLFRRRRRSSALRPIE